MTVSGILGLAFVLVFFGLILTFTFVGQKRLKVGFREIPAISRLQRAIGLSVEAGTRLHLSIGSGNIVGFQSAIAFVALRVLEQVSRAASVSDRPPVTTSGEGALAVLAADTQRGWMRATGLEFDPAMSRLTGLTPFPYAAGVMTVVHDEEVATNILIGSFGSELALITEAGEREGAGSLAGSDNVPGQAVLFVAAQDPLLGEEAFATGAYLGAGAAHTASLHSQDVLRWVVIAVIVAGAILKFVGVL